MSCRIQSLRLPLAVALSLFFAMSVAAAQVVAGDTQPANSEPAATPVQDFHWDPRVVRGTLPNGLAYFIVPRGKAEAPVSMHLIVRVGSLDERDDQSGVAHMVEHMVFRASARHPEGLHAFMRAQGWAIGADYNANTNFHRTRYMLSPAKQSASLDAALEVLAEIGGGARFEAAGLEDERAVILEEWRTKLGVRERMERQRREILRAGSLYPQRPTIGTEASVRSQSAEALRNFYADWYRPGNMSLVVVGAVDPADMEARIRTHFEPLVARALPARHAVSPELGSGLRIARLQDGESGSSQVGWVFRFHTDQRQDQAGLRERLIDRIAERVVRSMVRQMAQSLPSGVESLTATRGELGGDVFSLGFAASVGIGGHQAGLRQILLAQERLRRAGADRAAVAAEIAEIRRINDKAMDLAAQRETDVWLQMLGEALEEQRTLQDPVQKQAQIRAIVETITPGDVDARIRIWLASPDQTLFMMAPGLSPLPLPDVEAVRAQQQEIAIAPLPAIVTRSETAVKPMAPVAGAPGRILREQHDAVLGIWRWKLGNGDEVVWAQEKSARLQMVVTSGAGYRLPGAPGWHWQLAAQLARQADRRGMPPGALGAWAAAEKLSLSQSQSESRLSYSAQVSPAQFGKLLSLYAARQGPLHIEAEALQDSLAQLQREITRRPSSVSAQLARALADARFAHDPLDDATDAEALDALAGDGGAEQIAGLAAQLAARPVKYLISGQMAPARMRELVRRHLAGIPRQSGLPAAQALQQREGGHATRLAIGIEPQGVLSAAGSQALHWSPERAMQIAVLSRVAYRMLREELREKENGIYRLKFAMTLDSHSGRLASELYFTGDPARIDALWARSREVLESLPARMDEQVLADEIRRMRRNEELRRKDPVTRFQRLQLSEAVWGDARYLRSSARLLDTLDAAHVRAMATELALTRDMASVIVVPAAPHATEEGAQ